jgi:hypothetical protein
MIEKNKERDEEKKYGKERARKEERGRIMEVK